MADPNTSFSKTICSICYEDLKPIVEDLQSISICGHVFHELCLQQWFEYCTDKKKQTCPVCKQGCTKNNVGRLYFQSVGDSAVPTQCQSENPRINRDDGDCPEILRVEVRRLEAKVSNLSSALDLQQREVKQLTDELHICKEEVSKEVILKNEALRQRESIQSILQTKSSELVRTTGECSKLREMNTALVKELAALKLVSDCNLGEEEISKLASVGHEGNLQDTIDVLKKSLVIRNKHYKDLMAKCNSLGRGEARFQRKLEKAKQKIVKLKLNIQDLESTIEARDNEALRSLKAANTRSCNNVPTSIKSTDISFNLKRTSPNEKEQICSPVINLDDDEDTPFEMKETRKDDTNVSKCQNDGRSDESWKTTQYECVPNEECEIQKSSVKTSAFDISKKSLVNKEKPYPKSGLPTTSTGLRNDADDECTNLKETADLHLQEIRKVQPSGHAKPAASSFIPLVEPGDRCFAGGLMGPGGANMYLGKWCKRVQNNAPKGSSNGTDSLISVGADGRGGKVKVLRPFNQSTDTKDGHISSKRFKPGNKSTSLQSQGCMQIEHFFGKARS